MSVIVYRVDNELQGMILLDFSALLVIEFVWLHSEVNKLYALLLKQWACYKWQQVASTRQSTEI